MFCIAAQFSVINIVLVSLSLVVSTIVVNLWSRGVNSLSGPPALVKLVSIYTCVLTDTTVCTYISPDENEPNPGPLSYNRTLSG
jgi:hypothetical protein